MKTAQRLLLLIALAFTQNLATAQPSDFGNWIVYFGNQKISNQLNWYNEFQHRNYNVFGDVQQRIGRTGIGTNLTQDNNNILLGYGFVESQNYIGSSASKLKTKEHRIYQQYIYKNRFGRCFALHRFRLEERFVPNAYSTRFRYFLNLNIPINHTKMQSNTVYFSVYNELFLNLQEPTFDRNRIYGALGYVFTENIKVEIGAMNQSSRTQQRNQLQIVIYNNIPLTNQ
ncbi:MAG: hypothetical protein RLZZ548_601 [Bacteroidota bacterium]